MGIFTNCHKKYTSGKTLLALGITLSISTSAWAVSTEDDDNWIEEVIEAQKMIEVYDQNGDQLLSSTEVQQGIVGDMQLYDKNLDNQFSLSEFESMWDIEVQQYSQQMFYSLDTNSSQDISQPEFVALYKQLLNGIFTRACIDKEDILNTQALTKEAGLEIATMDADRNGRVNYTEFSKTERREMVEFFHDLDGNDNGQLNEAEYRAALNELADAAIKIKKELPVSC